MVCARSRYPSGGPLLVIKRSRLEQLVRTHRKLVPKLPDEPGVDLQNVRLIHGRSELKKCNHYLLLNLPGPIGFGED